MMSVRQGIVVWAIAGVLGIASAPLVTAQGHPDEIFNLLDRYARGDHDLLGPYRSPQELERLRQRLSREAETWIRRGATEMRRQRQLAAAAFALEAAHRSLDIDWGQGRQFVEWGSALLRKAPPDEPERLWHLAAVSLIQGAFDNALLVDQQKQAWPRFADEPRLLLALVIMLEGETWPDPDRGEPWNDDDAALEAAFQMNSARRGTGQALQADLRAKASEYQRRTRMRTAITLLEDLSNAVAIRAEAILRLGYLHLRLRRAEIALEQFEEVPTLTEEPFLLYLANFLAGVAHEEQADHGSAVTSYRAALHAVPRAQSASFALASLLFIGEGRDEAWRLVQAAVSPPVAEDPWRLYQSGGFRLWAERLSALRKAIR